MTIALFITILVLAIIGATFLIWYLYQHQYFLLLLYSRPFSPPIKNVLFLLLRHTLMLLFLLLSSSFHSLLLFYVFMNYLSGILDLLILRKELFILLDYEVFGTSEMFLLYPGKFVHLQRINL